MVGEKRPIGFIVVCVGFPLLDIAKIGFGIYGY